MRRLWAAFLTDVSEWHVVGDAINELGRFEDARRWFVAFERFGTALLWSSNARVARVRPTLRFSA
jgi:hypothetical protein